MAHKEDSASRTKILSVAAVLFAQKGFDATTVDEIARRARVNKAMIYYYFKNKEDILTVLFHEFIEDFAPLAERIASRYSHKKVDQTSSEEMKTDFKQIIEFMKDRRDMLKVLLMESLKETSKDPLLFRFMDEMVTPVRLEKFRAVGIEFKKDLAQTLMMELFTGVIPLVTFIIFQDRWARHYHIEESSLKEQFIQGFLESHVRATFSGTLLPLRRAP